jgi:hypothetical protein
MIRLARLPCVGLRSVGASKACGGHRRARSVGGGALHDASRHIPLPR